MRFSHDVAHITNLFLGGAGWPSGRVSDCGARGRAFDTYLHSVVSFSKDTFTPLKSTGNTQEVVAPSRHADD